MRTWIGLSLGLFLVPVFISCRATAPGTASPDGGGAGEVPVDDAGDDAGLGDAGVPVAIADDDPTRYDRCPAADEPAWPLVIEGAQVPALLGADPAKVTAFRWADGWRRTPLQVDERRIIDWPDPLPVYVFPGQADDGLFDADDDPTLDADDELVLPREALGDPAPDDVAWPVAAGPIVRLAMSGPGTNGVLYLFVDDHPDPPPIDDVTYERRDCANDSGLIGDGCDEAWSQALEDTRIATPCYEQHFSFNWVLDEWRVRPLAGGADLDLIDRWKGRAFAADPDGPFVTKGSEHEDTRGHLQAETGVAGLCGWSEVNGTTHTYVGHKDGPVRALRMIRGACSYGNMLLTLTFARAGVTQRIVLRGHAIPRTSGGLAYYWDYRADAAPLTYRRDDLDAVVTLDGQPDATGPNGPVLPAATLAAGFAEQAVGAAGGLGFFTRQTRAFPAGGVSEVVTYGLDDATFDDGSGEEMGVIGGHGLRFPAVVATEEAPAIFDAWWRVLPAGAGDVRSSLRAAAVAPLELEVQILRGRERGE